MLITQSPITEHRFAGQTFYLKRDDKLHPHFSGNKARKLMALLEGDFSRHHHLNQLRFGTS